MMVFKRLAQTKFLMAFEQLALKASRSKRSFRPVGAYALFFGAIVLLVGCGGGGGNSSSTTLLQGNAAHRAAVLAGYQGFAAGSAFPFTALKIVSPVGSAIRSGGAQSRASLPAAGGTASSHSAPTRLVGLTFVPALNLYASDPVAANNTYAINYYTDAAGTQSAGSMTMTLPANANGSTNYLSYPVQIPIVINLTAGNLPCSGTVTVNFTGQSGKNAMTGHLTMPKNKVDITIDLALSDTLDVSGTITGTENGATIHLTNCRGNLFGTLTCDLAIDPYGWKGTATGSLVTGAFTTQVSTTGGTASSSVDANGILKIIYPDATVENVSAPLTAPLVGTGTGPTGSATYGTPVNLGNINPQAINNSGGIAANESVNNTGRGLYLSAPNAAPQYLAAYRGTNPYGLSLDNSGEIVGFNSSVGYAYYTTPASMPTSIIGELVSLNATGALVGSNGNAYYQPSLAAGQIVLKNLSGSNASDATAASSNGQVVGFANGAVGTAFTPLYWSRADPQTDPTPLKEIAGSRGTEPLFIDDNGQIVGTTLINGETKPVYWQSPTDQNPQILPAPSTALGQTTGSGVFGMNSSGQIVGDQGNVAVLWKDGKVIDLNTVIPSNSGWQLTTANAINDQGWIVGVGRYTDATGTQTQAAFLIKPK
jgi:hypothetical protein